MKPQQQDKRPKEETLKIRCLKQESVSSRRNEQEPTFGLEQKTKLKLFPNKQKYKVRERLKRSRYEVERNGTDVYIDDETRRHAKVETEVQ